MFYRLYSFWGKYTLYNFFYLFDLNDEPTNGS